MLLAVPPFSLRPLPLRLLALVFQWNCPACRQRSQRPSRRAQLPSSLRGPDWTDTLTLPSPSGAAADSGAAGGAGARHREADGTVMTRTRGVKRSWAQAEVFEGERALVYAEVALPRDFSECIFIQ